MALAVSLGVLIVTTHTGRTGNSDDVWLLILPLTIMPVLGAWPMQLFSHVRFFGPDGTFGVAKRFQTTADGSLPSCWPLVSACTCSGAAWRS
jgi:hypothetical protein